MLVKLIRLPSKGNLTVGKCYKVLFSKVYTDLDTYHTVSDDSGEDVDLWSGLVEVV
jgi:hypothetical protein